jgi:hypothetical protein
MAAVLASSTGSSLSGHSYYGSLNFLDSQQSFDTIFPHPTPLLLSLSHSGNPTINTHTISATLTTFIDRCKFELFISLFRTDYVGTKDCNNASSLHATVQALKKLAISYRNPQTGTWTNLTPDELFASYSTLIPLLPARVHLWGLSLVNQYHNSLSANIQDLIVTNIAYTAPSLATLTTCGTQLAALRAHRALRVCAVCHHTNIRTQERIMNHTISILASVGTATSHKANAKIRFWSATGLGPCTSTGRFSPMASPRKAITVPWNALRAPSPTLYFLIK